MELLRVAGVVAIAALVVAAQPVCAQEAGPPARPFRALFGGDDTNQPCQPPAEPASCRSAAAVDNGLARRRPARRATTGDVAGVAELLLGRRAAGVRPARPPRRPPKPAAAASLPYYSLLPDSRRSSAYGANGEPALRSGPRRRVGVGSYAYSPFYSPALEPGYRPSAALTGDYRRPPATRTT